MYSSRPVPARRQSHYRQCHHVSLTVHSISRMAGHYPVYYDATISSMPVESVRHHVTSRPDRLLILGRPGLSWRVNLLRCWRSGVHPRFLPGIADSGGINERGVRTPPYFYTFNRRKFPQETFLQKKNK